MHVTEKGKKLVSDYDSRQKSNEEFKSLDPSTILKWSDKELAAWQSGYAADQAQWVLADHEWKRRAGISTRKIAVAAIVVSIFSAIIAALGLTVAALGYFNLKSPPAPLETKSIEPQKLELAPPAQQPKPPGPQKK